MNNESSTNLPATKAGTGIALSKAKSLHQLTNRMLGEEKHALLLADHWLDELIAWADENGVCDGVWDEYIKAWYGLPRDKQEILRLTKLNLKYNLTALPESSTLDNVVDGIKLFGNEFARLYPELEENKPINADITEKLVQLKHAGQVERDNVDSFIKKMTKWLSGEEIDLLQRHFSLKDQIWTYQNRSTVLKDGWKNIDELIRAKEKVWAEIQQKPELVELVDYRTKEADKLRERMVGSGVASKEEVSNPDYWPNNIIEYAHIRKGAGSGDKLSAPRGHGRHGTSKAMSQHYTSNEAEWMYKVRMDIKIAEFLTWLKNEHKYNRMPRFKRMALENNDRVFTERLIADVQKMLTSAHNTPELQKAVHELGKAKNKSEFADIYRENKELQELKLLGSALETFISFRQQSAINIGKLVKLYENYKKNKTNELINAPQHVIRALDVNTPEKTNIWDAIFWLAGKGNGGEMQKTALILLSIRNKRLNFEKSLIGKAYINPDSAQSLINAFSKKDKKGNHKLKVWQADAIQAGVRAMHMYSSKTLSEHLIQRLSDAIKNEDNITVNAIPEIMGTLNEALVMGGPKEEMILDVGIANTLDIFRDEKMEKELNVAVIPMTALPESLGNLTNLAELHLGYTGLTEFPEWIGNLSNLTKLDLGGNELTALPDSIGNLSNLTRLYLGGNKLTELPESLGRLRHLKSLALGRNPIKKLPPSLSHLQDIVTF